MDAFIGTILPVAFSFAPRGWALCNGATLSVNQNQALFVLLGTAYGGDGVTTFKLPDLRCRVPLNQGSVPGLQNYVIGSNGGVETVTLSLNQMPTHTHQMVADQSVGMTADPTGAYIAQVNNPNGDVPFDSFTTSTSNQVPLSSATLNMQGGGQAHENRQPYLTINYIICTSGIYPVQD